MSRAINNEEECFDYQGVCALLHISYETARKWKSMGELTYTKFRGRVLFPKSAILRELKKNTVRSTQSMVNELQNAGKMH